MHLYRIENGRQSMTLRTLKIIADALDVKMRDLIGNLLFSFSGRGGERTARAN